MLILRIIARMISVAVTVVGMGEVSSQDFPNKPVRIVTAAPGGVSDLGARLIAQGPTARLGEPGQVDNRGGGAIA